MKGRPRGTKLWEKARIVSRPRTVYDLSGLPLFHDFRVYRGRSQFGSIRVSANKALGDPVISTQVNPVGWDMRKARGELQRLVGRRHRGFSVRSSRLVCYSYPKLGLLATLVARDRRTRQILMDVGDFTEVPMEPGPHKEGLGQIPYSLLSEISEEQEREKTQNWEKKNERIGDLIRREDVLQPARFYRLDEPQRMKVVDDIFDFLLPYVEKTLDYCCHTGGCKDHDCFCLHPQENNVHCARASAQMMLCYYRYCYSQHEIAVAYGVADTALTPVSAVVPGLESLTHNCFDATLDWSVGWSECTTEINERRPFMSCVPGHARACAGTKHWNIWIVSTPQPKYLYIYDPWPPNTGAISWENFDTTNHLCMFTMVRRTTNHM